MTTWTSPKTWISEVLTATGLNTHLRDNLNHLYENKPFTLVPGLEGSADVAARGGAGSSEEWSTTTTGLTWTPSDPSTVNSHTTIPSHLYVSNQVDNTERIGTKAWVPGAGAFDARLGGVYIAQDNNFGAIHGDIGFHIGDSGNNNRLLINMQYTNNTVATVLSAFTYESSAYTQRGSSIQVTTGLPIFLRLTRDGSNNCSFYWSHNGILWHFIATRALTFTIANIGVRCVGNSTANFQAAFDWLRTSV